MHKGYFHHFSFGLDSYIDKTLLRVRQEVFDTFMGHFTPGKNDLILDVGVSADDHPSSNFLEKNYPYVSQIAAVGIDDYSELEQQFAGLKFVKADGRDLPFEDNSFDYVHSHAVIEHVGSSEMQKKFVDELYRVAKKGF